MAKLVIFRGDAVEHEIHLAGTLKIGRDSGNNIVLDDKSVSRFHAEVRVEGAKYFIVDLKSRNGVWLNGQQIKGKTALTLGVPVTLGAYELTLEDEVSTGEFDDAAPLLNPPTVVNAAPVEQSNQPRASATRPVPKRSPVTTSKRQVLLWSGVAAAIALIGVVTFAVVQYRGRSTPTTAIGPLPPSPPPPPPPGPEQTSDPSKEVIDQQLAAARAALQSRDYVTLRDLVSQILEFDPGNREALELKRQADQPVTTAPLRKPPPSDPLVENVPPPVEPETAGIPRRAGEVWGDYTVRVKRVQDNFEGGKRSADKQEYSTAITQYRLVQRDQPGYQGVESLIAQAIEWRRLAVQDAIDSGLTNERQGKLRDARQWYRHALEIDPGATSARDKNQSILDRMTVDANGLVNRASLAEKYSDKEGAIKYYQQILDLLLPGDVLFERARRQLEALKR